MQSSCVHVHSSLASGHIIPLHPHHPADAMLTAITGLSITLHPVHGLFACALNGYRAELQTPVTLTEHTHQLHTLFTFQGARRFLGSAKRGNLFIALPISLLLQHTFVADLHQLMQQHPELRGRLVLLCQPDALYPALNTHAWSVILQSLAAMDIQLGLDVPFDQPGWADTARLAISPGCVLIRYPGMAEQASMSELATTIRNCRQRDWPLLVDHRQPDTGMVIQ